MNFVDITTLKEKLKRAYSEYKKDELLNWMFATSILPGNEVYQHRFLILISVALSMSANEFSNRPKDFNKNKLLGILKITESENWDSYEDWEPQVNSSKNVFGIFGKIYYYLAGSVENPADRLEMIVERYFFFDERFKRIHNCSIKSELIKFLEYDTEVISFLEENKGLYAKENKFILPERSFVIGAQKFMAAERFANNFWGEHSASLPPYNVDQVYRSFDRTSFVEGKIYMPSILLSSYLERLRCWIKETLDMEACRALKKQLDLRVTTALRENPQITIINNFFIGNDDYPLDIGFYYDGKLFIINTIEELFDSDLTDAIVNSIQNKFLKINELFKNGPVEIRFKDGKNVKLDKSVEPIFIIVFDDIQAKNLLIVNDLKDKLLILSPFALNYIFEDLVDSGRDPNYLYKGMRYRYGHKNLFMIDFCDFYSAISSENFNESILVQKDKYILISPHEASTKNMKKIFERRPKIDLRPKGYPIPFTFKILKTNQNMYSGYNNYLGVQFLCYKDEKLEFYITYDIQKMNERKEIEIYPFITNLFGYYTKKFFTEWKLVPKYNKITIELVSYDWLKENQKNFDEKAVEHSPIAIGMTSDQTTYVVGVQTLAFLEFAAQYPQFLLDAFFDLIIKNVINAGNLAEIEERVKNEKPKKLFTNVRMVSETSICHNNFPPNLDFFDVDLLLYNKFQKTIKDGVYKGKEASKILNPVFNYLSNEIDAILKNSSTASLISFAYSEIEQGLINRQTATFELRYTKEPFRKRQIDFLLNEDKLSRYLTASRYLLERKLALKFEGEYELKMSDWQRLSALSQTLIMLSYQSDYAYYLSELISLELLIDSNGLPLFKFKKTTFDLDFFLGTIKRRSKRDPKDRYREAAPGETDRLYEILEGKSFKKISDELQKAYGFRLKHFVTVLDILTNLPPNLSNVVEIDKNKAIEYVYAWVKNPKNYSKYMVDLGEDAIESIIEFSTLKPENMLLGIGQGKIYTVEDRFIVKPIINIDGVLIFGLESIVLSEDRFIFDVADGRWPYDIARIPKPLQNAIREWQQENSQNFENAVVKKISEFTICEANLCKGGVGDKFLSGAKGDWPGQIDALSVQKDKRIITVWDAKDYSIRVGSREVASDVKDFEDYYNDTLNKKVEYVKNNMDVIFRNLKIQDSSNWSVRSCLVLSGDSLVKHILKDEINIITFEEIKAFIKH